MPVSADAYVVKCVSEMVGTYLLVLIGPASIILTSQFGLSSPASLILVAVAFGGTVATAIVLLGEVSGAHINPAVTIGSTIGNSSTGKLLLPYMASQITGGLLAGLSLRVILGALDPAAALGSTKLSPGVTPLDGIALEIVGTFVLTSSALVASSYVKAQVGKGLFVGGTLLLLILLIGPFTGASFNPARSLGPALFSGYFSNQWVYYLGPIAGAALAGLTFRKARGLLDRKLS